MRELHALERAGLDDTLALHHARHHVERRAGDGLGAKAGPVDLDGGDLGLVADGHLDLQAVAAKRAAGADEVVGGAAGEDHAHPGADGRPVGGDALQPQDQPVLGVGRVLEQRVGELVHGEGAAHLGVDVLVAVFVEVGEADAVALLQVAEVRGRGDVGERPAALVEPGSLGCSDS